jgi:hypothetical protein
MIPARANPSNELDPAHVRHREIGDQGIDASSGLEVRQRPDGAW